MINFWAGKVCPLYIDPMALAGVLFLVSMLLDL